MSETGNDGRSVAEVGGNAASDKQAHTASPIKSQRRTTHATIARSLAGLLMISAAAAAPNVLAEERGLEQRLQAQAAQARNPDHYVWVWCDPSGDVLRVAHGGDFNALGARSIADVSRIGWSSALLSDGAPDAEPAEAQCGEYRVTVSEGQVEPYARSPRLETTFPVVWMHRGETMIVPPIGLNAAICAERSPSIDTCPEANARVIAIERERDSDRTRVVLIGAFADANVGEPGPRYTLYVH